MSAPAPRASRSHPPTGGGGGRARRLAAAASCILLAACQPAIHPGAIDDAQAAARVKTVLVNDPDLGVRAIEVRVVDGTARLSGRVGTQAEAERAAALARAVPGITAVDLALQVGAAPPPPAAPSPPPAALGEIEQFEPQPSLGWLALGVSLGWSHPRSATLASRASVGPLVRLGTGRGLGIAIGLDWFKADVAPSGDAGLARIHVKPVMAGVSYTLQWPRVSLSPGIVAGYAFNGLSVRDTGAPAGALAVDVDNSLVWRPGASLWMDAGRRFAVNLSGGYLFTSLDVTVLEAGRLSKRSTRGNTLVLHAGLAYTIF